MSKDDRELIEHALLKRAFEVVHHDSGCPSIGGNGDADCKCDAVPFLRDLEATFLDFQPSDDEARAIRELSAALDLSEGAVIRQALRQYQADYFRRRAGETCAWSGDDQRARDFADPAAATRLEALQAQPVGEALPLMSAAFRTTITEPGSYVMHFKFPTMAALHAADDEWIKFSNAPAALTASPPVVEREAIARIIDPDCAKVTWAGTDDEQHIVRMRVCRERLKQWGDDGECDHDGRCEECSFDMAKVLETDASKARRAEALAKADAILALTPVEGVGEDKLTMTIRLTDDEQAAIERLMAEQELSRPQIFRCALRSYQADHERRKSGETVTWSGDAQRARDFAGPALSTPVAQGDEVRDALEPFARAAKNIPAKFADDRPVKAAIELTPDEAKAYGDVVSAQLIVSFDGISAGDFRNALATLTKGARDAG